MEKVTDEQIKFIAQRLKEGKPLPEEFKWLLFEGKQEAELGYFGKERDIDVITETMAVPLQRVKAFGKIKDDEWHNMLIFGDNLQVLKELMLWKEAGKLKNPDGSLGVKLIYIDPPFGTGDIYGKGDVGAYSAKMVGAKYLEWLRKRLILLKEILSDDGSIYVRIDYHFGHYVKVLMDEIFGRENFQNEIVINRTRRLKSEGNKFYISTDSIFFYTKTDNYLFNHVKMEEPYEIEIKCTDEPAARKVKRELEKNIVDCEVKIEKNKLLLRNQKWVEMHASSKKIDNPPRKFFGKMIKPPRKRRWMWNQEAIDKMIGQGFIRINKNNGLPELIRTWRHLGTDWTDIKGYSQTTGYPTENSEELLERIISAGSNEGDMVLDAFAGSGTAGAVAEKLGRRWIMIDAGRLAIYTMIKRMLNLKEEIGNTGKDLKPNPFAGYNAGLYDYKLVKELPFEQYRKFALELFQCKDEPHEVGKIMLDGYFSLDHVLVFKWKNEGELVVDHEFINELHSLIGDKIGKRFFIIAPWANVAFREDVVQKDDVRYFMLRIPYSVIDELHKKQFTPLVQPIYTSQEVNVVMEQVGFDFINPPAVECEYYIDKPKAGLGRFTGEKEAVIKIKKFYSNVVSKKPISDEDRGFKSLSMVMVDMNYNTEWFNFSKWISSKDIEKNDWEIRLDTEKLGEKIMVVYIDSYGNEKKEVLSLNNFKGNENKSTKEGK